MTDTENILQFSAKQNQAQALVVSYTKILYSDLRGRARRRLEELPFPDATFDAVISECTLCLLDKTRTLAEMVRVAKPGGCARAMPRRSIPGWRKKSRSSTATRALIRNGGTSR